MVNRVINLESDYEYVSGQLRGNIMNLQASFGTGEWAKKDLQIISNELVKTAKWFAVQQGLGAVEQIQDYSINGTPVYINRKKRKRTGTLIKSIKAKPENNTVVFWNDANLGRGYYAGHIEYGFHDRHGNPVAARPFMRPAFQAVARASRNNLSNTLQSFLNGGLVQNITAKFATPTSGSYRRAFYNQPSRGPNSGLKTISGLKTQKVSGAMSKMREVGTVRRGGNMKGFINNKLQGRSSPPRQFAGRKTVSREDSVTQKIRNFGERFSPSEKKAQTFNDRQSKMLQKSSGTKSGKAERKIGQDNLVKRDRAVLGNMLYGRERPRRMY